MGIDLRFNMVSHSLMNLNDVDLLFFWLTL
jgi:hypothetical protein